MSALLWSGLSRNGAPTPDSTPLCFLPLLRVGIADAVKIKKENLLICLSANITLFRFPVLFNGVTLILFYDLLICV